MILILDIHLADILRFGAANKQKITGKKTKTKEETQLRSFVNRKTSLFFDQRKVHHLNIHYTHIQEAHNAQHILSITNRKTINNLILKKQTNIRITKNVSTNQTFYFKQKQQ